MKLKDFLTEDIPDKNTNEMADSSEEKANVAPEEQEEYENFVLSAIQVIAEASDDVIAMLGNQQSDPVTALASTVFTIVTAMDDKSGGQVKPEILLHGSGEILSNIAELAVKAKVFEVDDQILGQASQMIVEMLAEEYGVDMESIQAELQSIDPGRLTSIVNQQSAYAQGGKK